MNVKLILAWGIVLAAITVIIVELIHSSSALIILGALVLALVSALILTWAVVTIVDN